MAAGLRGILPWRRLLPALDAPPEISARSVRDYTITPTILPSTAPKRARLRFETPLDASGRNAFEQPFTLITRMLRRIDAVSRWNGVMLADGFGAALAGHAKTLDYDVSGLVPGHYESPNRNRQTRRDPTLTGVLDIAGDFAPLWPLLRIAERCHSGRHAVEGLGAFALEW